MATGAMKKSLRNVTYSSNSSPVQNCPYMYQKPHNAPKIMISGMGVKKSRPLHADNGMAKRAIIEPSQSSIAVAKTQSPP
jgi:hypothetical protein